MPTVDVPLGPLVVVLVSSPVKVDGSPRLEIPVPPVEVDPVLEKLRLTVQFGLIV